MIRKENSLVSVNLKIVKDNVRQLKRYISDDTEVMAVIKADAYGHGAVDIAHALDTEVQAFAVNELAEAIELRKAGISLPILVFAVPESASAHLYKKYKVTATISAEEHFDILYSGTTYHLNFDTGMGRMGFHPRQATRIAELATANGDLRCTGLYSHFSTADNPDSELVNQQQALFREVRSHFDKDLNIHVTNTGGTVFYDTSEVDMVRFGIGIYGYSPGEIEIEGLKPALRWDTRLVQVRKIQKGSPVSYGAQWKMPSEGFLATIPVGYDDGIARSLTGSMSVRIKGKTYPVVGTITMNYCMVFLGDDFYVEGTKVELLYPEYNAKHWAQNIGTIPYEILTSINPRVPRKYFE